MMFLLYTIHVLISLFLIAVVLLQQGKGADLSVFGGGATQTAFGARGAASVLHKLTVGSFIGFILTTLAIGAVQANKASSVIQGLPEETIEEQVAPEPEGALPAEEDAEASEAEATEAEAGDTAAEDTAAATEDADPAGDADSAGTTGDETAGAEAADESASNEESGN